MIKGWAVSKENSAKILSYWLNKRLRDKKWKLWIMQLTPTGLAKFWVLEKCRPISESAFMCLCVFVCAQEGFSVNKDCCVKSLWQALTGSGLKWVWRTEWSPVRAETVPHFCNLRECPLLQLVNTATQKEEMTYMHNKSKSSNSSCWCEPTLDERAAENKRGVQETELWSRWFFL